MEGSPLIQSCLSWDRSLVPQQLALNLAWVACGKGWGVYLSRSEMGEVSKILISLF